MYEGKPLVLVIGGSDTGRNPIAAALLRKALGASVVVRTAGVLSHEGESAATEAQMALEQIGIDISRHISRPLRYEEHRNAELLLAVDRGTELVLFTEFPQDSRIACLPALADMPDVLDPHRMPLGIWVVATQQLSRQVAKALPLIRERLKLTEDAPQPFVPPAIERRASPEPSPLVLGTGVKVQWDKDEDMQRLLGLINGDIPAHGQADDRSANGSAAIDPELALPPWEPDAASPAQLLPAWDDETPAESSITDDEDEQAVVNNAAADAQPAPEPTPVTRAAHVERMLKLIETAEQMPEIVNWERLRQELLSRLRAVARHNESALDFAPAATLMIEGKLAQCAALPSEQSLKLLGQSIGRLNAAVQGSDLGMIGGELAQW